MSLHETRKFLQDRGIRSGHTAALIADRALARGVEIAPDPKGRLSLRLGKRRIWFDGAQSNINGVLARRCAKLKDVTSRLLRSHGVNAPVNAVFEKDQMRQAWAWAEQRPSVVIKPASGGMGRDVHLGIASKEDFARAFDAVAASSSDVLVEEFIEGVEHRVLLIYGEVVAAARRVPANVTGDGTQTVSELIEEKNRLRIASQNPVHYEVPLDEITRQELTKQSLSDADVPARGRQVWLRANSNVHSGGDGVDATDELRPDEVRMAERVAEALPGLRVAGLDMLLPRDGQRGDPHVLEVNAKAMITGHHYPWFGESRDAAGMLVDAMIRDGATREPARQR